MIKGSIPDTFICDACVYDSVELIEDWRASQASEPVRKAGLEIPTPKEICKNLDHHIIGQEFAKKILSVAVYNHYKRIGKHTKTELIKANVLLVGPTGSGKTLLCETIAKQLNVPFASADATSMTEAGYVGEDVESVLVKLVQKCDGDIAKAERGIVYIDEIDKIAVKSTTGRDISGEGVQQGFLKMLEGSNVSIYPKGKRNSQAEPEVINTKDILFICGGAFSGITDERNIKTALGIAAHNTEENIVKKVRAKDIIDYGMIPEFVGRFPLIAQLSKLEVEDLVKILTEPKNSIIKQYEEMLKLDGIKVKFTRPFLDEVAQKAYSEGTGARGLRAIMEPIMTEVMFHAPDSETKEVTISKDYIDKADKK